MSVSVYSIHPSFPTFNIKMIRFCTFQTVTSILSKALSWISKKNILQVSYNVFKDVVAGCKFWDLHRYVHVSNWV